MWFIRDKNWHKREEEEEDEISTKTELGRSL